MYMIKIKRGCPENESNESNAYQNNNNNNYYYYYYYRYYITIIHGCADFKNG